MNLPNDGADALRECARILAPLMSPAERATMARNIEGHIKSGEWTPVFRLPHVAALFYPKDDRRAAELLAIMERARETGAFPSTLPLSERGATMSDLAAWVECPPVPADSPLRYWLPQTMHGAEAPPPSSYRLEAWHLDQGIGAQLLRGMLAATPGEIREMYGVSPEEAALSLRCHELASLPAWDPGAMLDAATAQSLDEEQRLLWGLESRDALERRISLAMRAEGAPELLHPADAVLLLERHGIHVFHELREAVRRRSLSGESLSEADVRRYRALSGVSPSNEENAESPQQEGAESSDVASRQGRGFFKLEEAAQALGEQEGMHSGARQSLLARMMEAARDGSLTVRDPHTDLPYRPAVVREFWELVTPADVNAWLARCDARYRWNVPAVKPEPAPNESGAAGEPTLDAESSTQRRARLARRRDELKAQGVRDFTKRIAAEEGIGEVRVRQLLRASKPSARTPSAADPFGLTRKPIGPRRKR